ncbi:arsenate reductase (glutaredoxin) [Pseudaeromonas paramecii]|uniref:Arsenate reductase n=1 Tax=Pseudaeromonas paramecii TaxID=2138166 RepID=A0ABP8Q4T9_9GAMM
MLTIYHNPRCSKSRETLALLEARGLTPTIITYLTTPPSADELRVLKQKLGFASFRQMMRSKDELFKELGLQEPSVSEEQLLAQLVAHPALLERPLVVKGEQARLGRPPEQVLEIL